MSEIPSCLPKVNILTITIANWKTSHKSSIERFTLLKIENVSKVFCPWLDTAKNWGFPLRMAVSEMPKSAVFSGSVWNYKGNLLWKTSFGLMWVRPSKE